MIPAGSTGPFQLPIWIKGLRNKPRKGDSMAINRHHDPEAGHYLLAKIRGEQYGFLDPDQVRWLAEDHKYRLTMLLVRCGACRFTAPAQDVQHLIDIITDDGRDYVRDVSLPAGT
jgi:hypothetical protein